MELFYEDEYGRIVIEKTPFGHFIHCDIYKWSKESYKKALETWAELIEVMEEEGLSEIYAGVDSPKLFNFASMFGFEGTGLQYKTSSKEGVIMKLVIKEEV